jgi:gamma-glutamyltranspeptidase/glutathione hydrolase
MMRCRVRLSVVAGWLVLATPLARAQPPPESAPQSFFAHAAVAADHPLASRAGLEMLNKGGNAVDAAVATSFCLAVVRPHSCGIGGGGFMVVYIPASDEKPEQTIALNYRETAPATVGPDYYVNLKSDTASRFGGAAVGVPGTVAGLLHALEHFGTLDRAAVLAPAIRAAEEGFAADANHVEACDDLRKTFQKNPQLRETADEIWNNLCLGGEVKVGDVIRQPELARALKLIAQQGADAFYRGEIAHAIVKTVQNRGGSLALDDLGHYQIRTTTPLRGHFRNVEILSMPPPSSGGIAMQQIFGILERRMTDLGDPSALHRTSPLYVHLLTEAMKHAFADRSRWLADPAFVDVPIANLLAPEYLDSLASKISFARTIDSSQYGSIPPQPPAQTVPHDHGTSHLSVIDDRGMAVACTETINLIYGSLVTVQDFGFILNDQMDDFTTIPGKPNEFGLQQSERNLPQSGKRPLSSMSPTIVLRNGQAVLVVGASGGPRIISATTQCILNCLLFDMDADDAVRAPRFHHQWMPNMLEFEPSWNDAPSMATLRALGHETGQHKVIGEVQLIHRRADGLHAASDPRKGGEPAGR